MAERLLTGKYLRYWHTRFNNIVFGGKLARAVIKIEECLPGDAGYCESTYPATITVSPTLSLQQARSVLLHEMVHQWQYENKQPAGHGPSFKQWEEPCRLLTRLELWL